MIGQHSSWTDIKSGTPQSLILKPLLYYSDNDLSDDLVSGPKLFADGTSLFSIVKNIDNSGIDLNYDFRIINK